jgi:heme-degrading monooxygenase HmoA
VIARVWRGVTRESDAEEYGKYIADTGFAEYGTTPGNRGAWLLRRDADGLSEFITFSLWENREAVVAFAGEDIERASYYPEDDRFLVEKEDRVKHFDVVSEIPPPPSA